MVVKKVKFENFQKALTCEIYQLPGGHLLIGSLIHFPNHHNDQHPPSGGPWFIFLQFLIKNHYKTIYVYFYVYSFSL